MIIVLTQLTIGFSVISAAILLIAYVFFLKQMQKTAIGLLACACLLAGLTDGHACQVWLLKYDNNPE